MSDVPGFLHQVVERQNPGVWWRRSFPFPHVVCDRLFDDDSYADICSALRRILQRGSESGLFNRMTGYGADIITLRPTDAADVPLLLDRSWHDRLAAAVGVEHSGEIDAGIHRHPIDSATGWIHSDFSPGFFHAAAGPGEALIADRGRCDYKNGTCRPPGPAIERVRAASMIFYFDNEWETGAGGETGLYRYARQRPDSPDARVPPRNNSMVLFECTPHSYHSYVTNTRYPRHSVVLWLHRDPAVSSRRWGTTNVVRW